MSIDWTKPVETTSGEPVRVLCTDRPNHYDSHPVVYMGKHGTIRSCNIDGTAFGVTTVRNSKEKHVVQIYRFKLEDGSYCYSTWQKDIPMGLPDWKLVETREYLV